LGAYLDQAVQSVLDQSFEDFEIIIIDDGSTDPVTRHLFTSYRRPKTRVLRTLNQGLAKANLGSWGWKIKDVDCKRMSNMTLPHKTWWMKRASGKADSNSSD
jgi:glycosyltransferase involved in cell wall biosynthesis